MIVDFAKGGTPDAFTSDVCLVGAGAAGIALALTLARGGISVTLVESGGITPQAADQTLNRGEGAPGVRFTGLEEGRARALGGATKLWYGQCIRLEESDFAVRPWVHASGWPMTAAELAPFYDRAEAFFHISDLPYDGAAFTRFGVPAPAFDPKVVRPHFTIYSPDVDLGAIHRAELTASPRVTVVLHANVLQVTTDRAAARATGVRISTLDGRHGTVTARAVILCGGGIENARLLLLSNTVKRSGLGNDRDLVGRYFQDHPNGETATLSTADPQRIAELFSLFYEKTLRFFPKLALSPELQARSGALNCNGHFVFEYPDGSAIAAGKEFYRAARRGRLPPDAGTHLRDIVTHLPETVRAAKRFFIDRKAPLGAPSRIRFQCYLEQEPNAESRVQLAATRDALGLPQASVTWNIGERERITLATMTNAVAAEVSRLGLGVLTPDAWLTDADADWRSHLGDAYHHIGTTRMATDARDGVVDPQCAVFGVAGLYVAGSSVFPTSGYANPTLTIVALALRLAAHVTSELRHTLCNV